MLVKTFRHDFSGRRLSSFFAATPLGGGLTMARHAHKHRREARRAATFRMQDTLTGVKI